VASLPRLPQPSLPAPGLRLQVDETIYATDANSTAYKYPLADASLLRIKGSPAGGAGWSWA
jgi:hypothetical protein